MYWLFQWWGFSNIFFLTFFFFLFFLGLAWVSLCIFWGFSNIAANLATEPFLLLNLFFFLTIVSAMVVVIWSSITKRWLRNRSLLSFWKSFCFWKSSFWVFGNHHFVFEKPWKIIAKSFCLIFGFDCLIIYIYTQLEFSK